MPYPELPRFAHATFRTDGHDDLLEHVHASWLWQSLERSFPDALQAVLMPNHGHLILPVSSDTTRRLGAILGRFTHRFRDDRPSWLPVGSPRPIADRLKLRRQFRYVALNGCRARLTGDPLAWRWSTYRDLMGAIARPWVDVAHVADALGWPLHRFRDRLHAYVSGDPSCDVAGTEPPHEEIASMPSLDVVLAAAAAALRSDPARVDRDRALRRLFIQLAARLRWHRSRIVAEMAGCSVRTVRRLRSTVDPADSTLVAALRCVADPRFRR